MGMPLSALSLQNEPNFKASYESADWSAEQFHNFLGVVARRIRQEGRIQHAARLHDLGSRRIRTSKKI